MKLHLLFIVMDLLIVVAYPILYMHGKWRQLLKPKETIALVNPLLAGSITASKQLRKKGFYAYGNH